jgi:hypothetical protein
MGIQQAKQFTFAWFRSKSQVLETKTFIERKDHVLLGECY